MNVELKNISVNFSYKTVLNNVNVSFNQGMIHGLLGENGAGKSTLANIINGEIHHYSGKIFLNNKETILRNSKDAIKNGICCVHQNPMLAGELSIRENLLLGLNKINNEEIKSISGFWLKNIPLSTKVNNLGSDNRFFIALISALLKNPKVLILDEPSALLDKIQRDFLFSQMKCLAKKGMNIIIITHNFREAEKYCDTISILKNGEISENFDFLKKVDFSQKELMKTSKRIENHHEKKLNSENQGKENHQIENHDAKYQMFVKNVSVRPYNKPAIFNINFSVTKSEIVFIHGLPEAGLDTLEDLLTGFSSGRQEGEISFENEWKINLRKQAFTTEIIRNSIILKENQKLKTGIIPTNRKFRGSNPEITISQLISMHHPEICVEEVIEKAKIQINPEEKVKNLSGGMLQRLILYRELSAKPDLLILCNPLQGLDFKFCEEAVKVIQKAADDGTMVIILSTDDYLGEMATRKYKLSGGFLEEEL